MSEFTLKQMQDIQIELQEKYKNKWGGISLERSHDQLLWLYGELGEVVDIIKKQGNQKIMEDSKIRTHFIEELCDVMMYFNDLMLCYAISPEEFKEIYLEKHEKNMGRW